ncbi:TPA: RHS repeat-associated core domain-containing protein [Pseudomonas putida]|uniref:Uncharacterized protein n=1 Tax=Pseudomonas putida TaxID=303 RepID=A0A7V8EIC8_PSEPU|nr:MULTISPECIES: RHS repeat-associated core domain-containing protein [Pseudomonas]KAF0255398.1 hypothetical protein GN299_08160 [Pseudomonas putida]MBH3351955.1 hypothetical protein [Pseudomonas putida]MBH3390024.1 hypothetical protein [Pseudomonas putida]MBS5844816.1 hypothetical protein [Pseudomonas putida]MDD1990535.1 hypothetical protein [Pseudomonas putida]
MKSPHPQRLFYNSNKLSSIIQDKEHTAIMHGSQLPLAEKVLAGGDAVAHTRMLSTDRLDSTIVNSTNAEQHVLTFTPYGYIDPLQIKSLLGFTGQLRQAVTGCYLLGSRRAFNPITMRFNSYDDRSPFAEGNINGYAYCGCDPINYTDPSGRSRWGWIKKNILRITPNTAKYDTAFERGRQQGYNEARSANQYEYEQGFDAGHTTGFDKGINAGHKIGFNKGVIQGNEYGHMNGMNYGSVWGFAEGKISGSKRLNRPLQTFPERAEHILTLPLPLGNVRSKYFNANQNQMISNLANLRHQEAGLPPIYPLDLNISPTWNSETYIQFIRESRHTSPFNPTGS